MSLFGVPSACARCGKKVYAAEQKLAEDKNWHSLCWSLEFKDREAAKKHHKDVTSFVFSLLLAVPFQLNTHLIFKN